MDYTNFRSAIGGFRRSDVFSYIERTSQEHRQAIRDLEKKNAALLEENSKLTAELQTLRAITLNTELPSEEPANLDQQELAAYRRAEAAERSARRRVAKLSEQLTTLTNTAGSQLESVCADASALTTQLNTLSLQAQEILNQLHSQIQALEGEVLSGEQHGDE